MCLYSDVCSCFLRVKEGFCFFANAKNLLEMARIPYLRLTLIKLFINTK